MKNIWVIAAVVVVLGGLLFWAGSMQKPGLVLVEGTDVACLPSGHENLAVHIHPELSILVDGVSEPIPANIGITPTCMAEVHTHDATGVIHIETVSVDRLPTISLSDFFSVWGKPVERDGYAVTITVNGQPVQSVDEVRLEDHAKIVISYVPAS